MADLKTLDALSAYSKIGNLTGAYQPDESLSSDGASFTHLVQEALGKTVDKLKTAEAKSTAALKGDVSMEELAVAVANAEMSLKTVIAIRDKLITAFQDIIRMPI